MEPFLILAGDFGGPAHDRCRHWNRRYDSVSA